MSEQKIDKTSEIKIKVHSNKERIPVKMEWQATDAAKGFEECKAAILSIWDGKEKSALRIDLWTNDMRVDEMNHFMYQTLITLADTYLRATNNESGANDIRRFSVEFGEKAKVLKKS